MAKKTIQEANLSLPVLVDEFDNPLYCSYGQRPNNAFLIGMDGRVLLYQEWSNPPEMESVILEHLAQ